MNFDENVVVVKLLRSLVVLASSEACVGFVGLLNESDEREARTIGFRRIEDFACNWSMRDQAIAIQRDPLSCVLLSVIDKPLKFTCAIRKRRNRNGAVPRRRLVLPLVEQVPKPVPL